MALSKALQQGFEIGAAYLEADSDRLVKAVAFKDWLVAYCGQPKDTQASKEAWSECRKALCPVTGKVNEVLAAAVGKHISECDENTRRARMDQVIRTFRSQILNGRDGKKGVRKKRTTKKATVTKVTVASRAQVRDMASKPKRLADTLRVILATIQAQNEPVYRDQPRLVAALQVAIDLAQ
jgi:hypothetical protein